MTFFKGEVKRWLVARFQPVHKVGEVYDGHDHDGYHDDDDDDINGDGGDGEKVDG